MEFIYPCLTVLTLYFFNKKYNYKSRLIKAFGLTSYRTSLLIPFLIYFFVFIIKSDKNLFDDPIVSSLYFSFLYLMRLPKDLR